MYFEIENTPERAKKKLTAETETEEVPTLILKPFIRPPQVIFENVPIGVCVERYMNIVNPTQKSLQIFLGKALPQELKINLAEGSLLLDPQDCVCVTLRWTPWKPTAHRETIHFTDQYRGRYDVIIVLKAVVVQKLITKKKLLRLSPTKLSTKKIGVRSPKLKYRGTTSKGMHKSLDNPERRSSKRKVKSIPIAPPQQLQNMFVDFHLPKHEPTTFRKFELHETSLNDELSDSIYSGTSDKENKSPFNLVNYVEKIKSQRKCLTSPNSVLSEIDNLNFTPLKGCHHEQAAGKYNYREFNDTSLFTKNVYNTERDNLMLGMENIVQSQETDHKATDIFDNFNFTPLKTDLRDHRFEIDTPTDIRRETYAVKQFPAGDFIKIENKPTHMPNQSYPVIDLCNSVDTSVEYIIPTKHATEIFPNGKSIIVDVTINKENTAINIDTKECDDCVMRKLEIPGINMTFNNLERTNFNDTIMSLPPHLCSTARKCGEMAHNGNQPSHICRGLFDNETCPHGAYGICNSTVNQLSAGKSNKGDSPIVPLDPKNPNNLQSSPYSTDPQYVDIMQGVTLRGQSKCQPKSLMFMEESASKTRRITKDRNCADGVRSIIEANMWQKEVKKSPLRSLTPPLISIPEESMQNLDSKIYGKGDTYTVNRTYDHCKVRSHHDDNFSLNQSRISTTTEANLWKVPTASIRTIKNRQQTESSHHAVNPEFLIGNVYTSSSTVDPFLSATYFYDEQSVDRLEQEFKRWLNYLLTPPAEFETDGVKIDVGNVWIETKNKEIPAAPTREQVSSQYHNSHRLDSLRKAARNLIMSPQMSKIFLKLGAQIDKQIISIRKDKCLHLDIGLQKLILDILFCYNPLWLRIGLEAIYGTVIPLSSNSDMYGLSVFIIQNMFKDPYIFAKHQNHKMPNMLREAYTDQMKKFTLKKYFMLVYFLDQAKEKKLICHDPCLFRRNAPCKESRDMLIRFTREVIAGIGDITKHLRPLGYVVTHKQSYLDEFKYAVHNLAVDLKDGIRLTKVMEIILVKDNLTKNLRTPAISLLQKVHNCKVALQALNDANFNIIGDITPRDIVDGHREKTLSLLWQIIHVFRAPLFIKAAITIQAWWKNKYLGIIVRKRIEHKKLMVKHNAASVIQIRWRRILYNRIVDAKMRESTAASIVVQKYFRMWRQRTMYVKYWNAAVIIQRWYRNVKEIQQAKSILEMLVRKHRMASKIQNWYRKQITASKLLCIRDQYIFHCVEMRMLSNASNMIKQTLRSIMLRKRFRNIVKCVIEREKVRRNILTQNMMAVRIQSFFRGYLQRRAYLKLKCACIKLQSRFKSIIQRRIYLQLKCSTQVIESRYLAVLHMRKCRSEYENLYKAGLFLQRQYRARIAMLSSRNTYLQLKQATELIQHKYRAKLAMRCDRKSFLKMKTSCIIIQSHFRMYTERRSFQNLKFACIKLQSHLKAHVQRRKYLKLKCATIIVETRYKAILNMRKCRSEYENLYKAVLFLQWKYRARIAMLSSRNTYLQLKQATELIQHKYRAKLAMRCDRKSFVKTKTSCIIIQSHFRMYIQRRSFQNLKFACIKLQSHLKAHVQRRKYLKLKCATIIVETRYKAILNMRKCRSEYENLYKAVLFLQWKYRARIAMLSSRNTYLQLKQATELIQHKYRAKLAMRCDRKSFVKTKTSCIIIQSHFRMYIQRRSFQNLKFACIKLQSHLKAHVQRRKYLKLKCATIIVETRYKAILNMRKCRSEYENLYKAVLFLQWKYRARIAMLSSRNTYLQLKQATELIQHKYRAKLAMRCDRKSFVKTKTSCIIIQSHFRMYIQRRSFQNLKFACIKLQSHLKAHVQRRKYLKLKCATIIVETRYKAILNMRKCRSEYENLYKAVLFLQWKYRARIAMLSSRNTYLQLKQATELIQHKYRAKLAMRCDRKSFVKTKTSCIIIQSHFRMYIQRRSFQNLKFACIKLQSHLKAHVQRRKYLKLKCATITVETRYKAILNMRKCRFDYERLHKTILFLQRLYRAKTEMVSTRKRYLQLKHTTEFVQRKYKAKKAMRYERDRYLQLMLACIMVQRRYRANKLRNWHVFQYQRLRNACVIIQNRLRANRLMSMARNSFILKKNAAIAIQRYYRGYRKRKIDQETYVHVRNSILQIQTVFRSYLVTKQIRTRYIILRNTVITVQRRYRAIKEMQYYRHQYVSLKTASIVIQKTYRGRKERDNYLALQHSTIMVQRRYRAKLLMKARRSEYCNLKNAATRIQTWYRATLQMQTEQQSYRRKLEDLRLLQVKVRAFLLMKSQKKNYQQLRHAAIVLQRCYRSITLRRETHRELERRTTTIQRSYRSITLMRLHSRQFLKLKMATVVIQRHYKSTLAMRQDRSSFVNKRMAAVKIQRFYRSICIMRLCRNEYARKRAAALVIQTSYRMHKQRMHYLRLKIAVICLQRYLRSYCITKKFQKTFEYTKVCIIKVQSTIRMSLHRKRYLRMRAAALVVQFAYRQMRKIELARVERRRMFSSIICIQKNCRTYLAVKRYRTLRSCVLSVQQRWRSILLMRTIREEYTRRRNIVICLQARIRGIVARHKFAKGRQQIALHNEERRKNVAVLKIQSVWRGYRVRKQMEDWTRLVKLRKRWQEGALQSKQETLSERNEDALQVLCHFRDVASVIRAFTSLDLLTCVYPMLYLTDNKAKSVCARIIMYIALTNRSISILETLRLGGSIIVNMARYKPTALLVYEDGQVSYILKSMLKWCDKDSLLFCSLCTYLWLFGKYDAIAQDLKKILKSGENYKMLCKIRGLVQRRKRMQENSIRQKANASSTYCNMSFNMTMNQSQIFKDNSPPTPQLEPDFGLVREGGVRLFQNEMHAIDSVFLKFNIPIND